MLKLFSVKSFSVNCGYVDKLLTNCGYLCQFTVTSRVYATTNQRLSVTRYAITKDSLQLPGMCMAVSSSDCLPKLGRDIPKSLICISPIVWYWFCVLYRGFSLPPLKNLPYIWIEIIY